MYVVNIVML